MTTEPPQTGDPRVDDALRRLADLADLDVAEHPARYDTVHEVLRDVLNSPVQPA